MEPGAEEAEETTLASEMFIKTVSDKQEVKSEEAILQPWQVFEEPIVELQRMNIAGKDDGKKAVEDDKDEEGSEMKDEMDNKVAEEIKCAEKISNMPTDANESYSNPTNETTSSNSHTSPPETNKSDTVERRKLTKTPSFGKTVRFMETEAGGRKRQLSAHSFSRFEIEDWTTTSFEELFLADHWKDITGKMSTTTYLFSLSTKGFVQ